MNTHTQHKPQDKDFLSVSVSRMVTFPPPYLHEYNAHQSPRLSRKGETTRQLCGSARGEASSESVW